MAIKTSVSRDTFRSDVKSRPFGQLGQSKLLIHPLILVVINDNQPKTQTSICSQPETGPGWRPRRWRRAGRGRSACSGGGTRCRLCIRGVPAPRSAALETSAACRPPRPCSQPCRRWSVRSAGIKTKNSAQLSFY